MSVSIVRKQETLPVDPQYGTCPHGHDLEYNDKGRVATFHSPVDMTTSPHCGRCGSARRSLKPTTKVWTEIKIVCDGCGELLRDWKHEGSDLPSRRMLTGACSKCGTRFGPSVFGSGGFGSPFVSIVKSVFAWTIIIVIATAIFQIVKLLF